MATLHRFQPRHFILAVGLLACPALRATAQTVPDTTHLKYSEEAVTLPADVPPLRVQEEPQSLWKLGLNNFLLTSSSFGFNEYYTRYGVHLAYERRLRSPAWTVLGELSPALTSYRPDATTAIRQRLGLQGQVAGRYYHNREQRLLRGRNVSNFSANYLSAALGVGLGRESHETPYFLYRNSGRQLVTADVALLYGWQRRLGGRGFFDTNVGVAALLLAGQPVVNLTGSLRLGLALGPQPPKYVRHLAPASEVVTLRPRFYAGAEIGGNFYHVRYAGPNPYPARTVKTTPTETQITKYPTNARAGYGTYAQYVSAGPVPSMYAGYYLAPRLALQVGFQYGESFNEPAGTLSVRGQDTVTVPNQTLKERGLALPVLLRYSLTRTFLKRLQFDAVGGLVPVWSWVDFREYAIVDRNVTSQETFGFRRSAFGLHAALGLDASYAFGRRRRVQFTTQMLLNRDFRTFSEADGSNLDADSFYAKSGSFLAGGFTFGLRYRFGYQ